MTISTCEAIWLWSRDAANSLSEAGSERNTSLFKLSPHPAVLLLLFLALDIGKDRIQFSEDHRIAKHVNKFIHNFFALREDLFDSKLVPTFIQIRVN